MNRMICIIAIILTASAASGDAIGLRYYLPDDVAYNSDIPTPEAFFGFQVGQWHLRHDQVAAYVTALSERSDRIRIETYAHTHQRRPLHLLTITSPQNHRNISHIRAQHLRLSDPDQSAGLNIETMPVVVYMGYSIHGNEPSGGNAAVLVAYHLAAAQGPDIDALLSQTVILLDPVFNPDGFDRFALWANSHRGKHVNADPEHREHVEAWPGGRTNHYWFDLNRDWLLLQHPESIGRMEKYHAWKPNLLTDHHEMGTNSTYFFQPGVPARNYPLTPERTFELTAAIARYHADALDGIQSLYYTKETFDDFYIGKGSTYPDLNGGVGILFEQASSRGHIQESVHGPLSFPFTIRNQVRTSLSTLKAARELRTDLLEHQRTFYTSAIQEAARAPVKAYVFGDPDDPARTYHFLELLHRHDIRIHELARPFNVGAQTFSPGAAYIAPLNQPQYRLLTAMFERRTSFQDSLFYDVSAWTLPLAFNMPFAELRSAAQEFTGDAIARPAFPEGRRIGSPTAYAYAFEWKGYYAPRALYRLQKEGVIAKVATRPFRARTGETTRAFDYGSILIPMGIQKLDPETLHALIDRTARQNSLEIFALETGMSAEGIDLGSPGFDPLDIPRTALLVGSGASAGSAGEVWHLFDQRYDMDVSLIETERIGRIDLNRYNTLILAGGTYNTIDSADVEEIKRWLQNGNTLIALDNAVRWAVNRKFFDGAFITRKHEDKPERKAYIDASADQGAQVIGGAIFQVRFDRTHPLAYGYAGSTLPVFRRGTLFLEPGKSPYDTPFQYTRQPLLSGYISPQNLDLLRESASVLVGAHGYGRVVLMTDNPTLRAYWYGTQKLLANALFFSPIISRNTLGE